MTQPTANCPNCGAKIVFRWSSSVQTVCEYCKSILVRTDVDLKKVGQVADLPPNSSPIQIGSEGVYDRQAFVAVGRIIYEYDQGTWNEWHLVLNNGSAWLSDAQDDYVVTFAAPGRKLPPGVSQGRPAIHVGQRHLHRDHNHESALSRRRRRIAVPVLEQGRCRLRRLDVHQRESSPPSTYSDETPVLYLGQSVEFDNLKLKNLRKFEGWS